MKKIMTLLCLFAVFFSSCNQVDSSPVNGAKDFCEEMSSYVESNNYDKANECLERYWNAYSKTDNLNRFLMALRDEFSSSKYHHVVTFIDNCDIKKYPLFLDFKAQYIATCEILDRYALDDAIKLVGKISVFEGFGEGQLTYDIDDNEVKLLLTTKEPIKRIQTVDKQLALEGLRVAMNNNSRLLKLMTDAKASFSFWYSNNSKQFEVAKLTPNDIQEMLNNPIESADRKEMLLENYIAKTNSGLPNVIAEGVTYRKIQIKGDYIVQEYNIDEDIYDVKEIENMFKAHKYDKVDDPIERNEYDIYTSHGKGLRIEYYSKGPKPVFVITYSVDELKKLLNP